MLRIIERLKNYFIAEGVLPENCLHPDSNRAYAHLLAYFKSIKNFLVYYYTYEMVDASVRQAKEAAEEAPYKKMSFESRKLLTEHQVYFDIAVIAWCRLFGSAGSNQTHWKNIFDEKCLRIACKEIGIKKKAELKNRMLKKTNITNREFKSLWKSMIDYRNKYVAHHDLTEGLNTDDDLKIKQISLGIVMRPDLKKAKLLILSMYEILAEVSDFLQSEAIVRNHYLPEEAMDDMCAEIAGNTLHKKRWRN